MVVPAKHHFREWSQYQDRYLRLISHRGDAATLHRRFQTGLQQTWLPDLAVVDRCATCHVEAGGGLCGCLLIQPREFSAVRLGASPCRRRGVRAAAIPGFPGRVCPDRNSSLVSRMEQDF